MRWVLPVAALALLASAPTHAGDHLTRGAEIYGDHCASCHGADLEGQPDWRQRKADGRLPAPPHDETGHTWHHPDQVLFAITKQGVAAFAPADYASDMPAFDGVLSDDEIVAVIAYIKSTWPTKIQLRQQTLTEGYQDQ